MKFWKFPGDSDEVPGHWKLPCARTEFCNKWIKLAEVVARRDRLGVSCWIHLQGDGGVLRSLFYVPKEACEGSIKAHTYYRFPRWLRDKESAYQCRRLRFDPWVGKIPWKRKWLPPRQVFLPEEFHGQRSLAEVLLVLDTTEWLIKIKQLTLRDWLTELTIYHSLLQ